MDSTFRSWYEKPAQQRRSYAYHPSLFGVPVYPVDPNRQTHHPAYADRQPPVEKKSGRRVVQIPVQFFGYDSDRRSESALRIQKVFRGFFVRKSVRKIKEIKAQVDEIEAGLLRDEVVDMIRGSERERLRMSESLMNLLLKLDGIRGIDSGIRVCRKGVTRKAIALQEKIDALCDSKVENGDRVPAATKLEGPRSENSEDPNGFEEMLDDLGEESKGLNDEKMEVEKDSVLAEELDVVVASEANPDEETLVEKEIGTSKNIDFNEGDVDTVKEVLVQYDGKDMINEEEKEDDPNGNSEFLANYEFGGILCDLGEEHDGGKDVEVENEILEVERNHLDTEHVGVPVTSVVEVTPETCPVQGILEDLDLNDDNAETVKEMLAFSDDLGEKLCHSSKELKAGDSLEVGVMTMEDEREHLDLHPQSVKEAPDNLDFGVERAESMKEIVERSGEDMAIEVEKEDLGKKKCELLEQLIEENKKMMNTVTQLYERNELQLQMLDALTNRVELLEKAYLCDKLRNRRKKMKKNKCAATCVEN